MNAISKKKLSTVSNSDSVLHEITIALSTNSDDLEPLLKDRCLCGTISVLIGLRLIALFSFFLDALCIYLALERKDFLYYFVNTLISFTVFCSILSGIQQEQKDILKFAKFTLMAKCLLVLGLLGSLAYSVINHIINTADEAQITVALTSIALITALNAILLVSIAQLHFTARAIRYVRIRDQIYTISNPPFQSIQSLDAGQLGNAGQLGKIHGLGAGQLGKIQNLEAGQLGNGSSDKVRDILTVA